jgi:hypothetical protein
MKIVTGSKSPARKIKTIFTKFSYWLTAHTFLIIAGRIAEFVTYPMPKTIVAGFPTKFATYFSNSLCNTVVPNGKTALVNMLMDKYPKRKKGKRKNGIF